MARPTFMKWVMQVDESDAVKSFRNVNNSVDALGKSFDALKKIAVGWISVAAVRSLNSFLKDMSSLSYETSRIAQGLNLTYHEVQGLGALFRRVGGDVDDIAQAIQSMFSNLGDALAGVKGKVDDVNALGIDPNQLVGVNTFTILELVITKLGQIKDEQTRFALGEGLFGEDDFKRINQMLPLMEKYNYSLEETIKNMVAANEIIIIPEEQQKRLEGLRRAFTILGERIQGISKLLAADIADEWIKGLNTIGVTLIKLYVQWRSLWPLIKDVAETSMDLIIAKGQSMYAKFESFGNLANIFLPDDAEFNTLSRQIDKVEAELALLDRKEEGYRRNQSRRAQEDKAQLADQLAERERTLKLLESQYDILSSPGSGATAGALMANMGAQREVQAEILDLAREEGRLHIADNIRREELAKIETQRAAALQTYMRLKKEEAALGKDTTKEYEAAVAAYDKLIERAREPLTEELQKEAKLIIDQLTLANPLKALAKDPVDVKFNFELNLDELYKVLPYGIQHEYDTQLRIGIEPELIVNEESQFLSAARSEALPPFKVPIEFENVGKDFGEFPFMSDIGEIPKTIEGGIEKSKLRQTFETLGDTLEGSMTGWYGSFADTLLSAEQDFGAFIESILRDIAKLAIVQALTNAFSGMFGGGTGGSIPTAALASGGIVTRPTLALIGEAGPEAVVPLGGGAGGVEVNVYEAPGATATVTATEGPGGQTRLDVIIEQVDAALAGRMAQGNSALGQTGQALYGWNRALGASR